jgi:hypothetical protein
MLTEALPAVTFNKLGDLSTDLNYWDILVQERVLECVCQAIITQPQIVWWVYKGLLYPLDLVIFKYNKGKVYKMDQTLSIRIVKLQEYPVTVEYLWHSNSGISICYSSCYHEPDDLVHSYSISNGIEYVG